MNNNSTFSLLVVDDDQLIHQSIKMIVPQHWKVFSAFSEESLQAHRFYHAALVDMHLKPTGPALGPKIIKTLIANNPQLQIIAISGDITLELMESCLKAGAQRFIAKPLMPEEIKTHLEKIEALWMLHLTSENLKKTNWIGSGPSSQKIRAQVAQLKGEQGPFLIEGETGAGKEVVARLLNEQEATRPMLSVNCAGIPENLFESEIFGHVKGAFTGADQNKIGLIEAAQGGDLFLDEIEAMPLHHQAKLLRFLETGEFKKVGAKENMKSDCRVLVASNRPLTEMVKTQEFREDLLFRLNTFTIKLPPLRDRLEDLAELTEFFLAKERPRRNKKAADEAITAMMTYRWPGNVRELKRFCEQLALTSPLPIIRTEDVLRWTQAQGSSGPALVSANGAFDFSPGLNAMLEQYEKAVVAEAMKQTQDVEQASTLLKVSRSNLYKKIKDYGLE